MYNIYNTHKIKLKLIRVKRLKMSFKDIDLDIENYDFNDLLNLFKLQRNYDGNDLKRVKMIVLKLHPDKSGLDNDIYIFYRKCYNFLVDIYSFTNSNYKSNTRKTDIDIDNKLFNYFRDKDSQTFNKEFNHIFESCKIKEESKNIFEEIDAGDKSESEIVDDCKTNALVVKYEPSEYSFMNSSSRKGSGALNIFDFEDNVTNEDNHIQKVYLEETVIPIDERYLASNPRNINCLDDLKRQRDNPNSFRPLSQDTSEQIINNSKLNAARNTKQIAYEIMRKDHEQEKKINEFISKYNLIKD